jgi:hypothetical protein
MVAVFANGPNWWLRHAAFPLGFACRESWERRGVDGEREAIDIQSPDMSEMVGSEMAKDGKRGGGDWELQ